MTAVLRPVSLIVLVKLHLMISTLSCVPQTFTLMDGMMTAYKRTQENELQQACKSGDLSSVTDLLSQGADLHTQNPEVGILHCKHI